jgi:RNA polymerase sigma factor (sigma-70 family)
LSGFIAGAVYELNAMNDDASLLRSYADENSEAAFAELVRRHVDLVYGAALRRTGGDAHDAADIAQQVFTTLARNARKLSRHTVVGAWLHTATRNAALNLMISDQRRKAREAAAFALHGTDESSPEWERLRPLLDEAIDELPEANRSAVVLRFLERRAFAEIGATLRLSEDTARKRVDRALEKLREVLARRGVKSTSAALAAAFANEVAAMAPAGLATAITGVALAGAATGGAATVAGTALFMSNTSTAIISVVALAALGGTFFQWNHAQRAEAEVTALMADRDSLRARANTEQQRTARVTRELADLQSEVAAFKAKDATFTAAPDPVASPARNAGTAPPTVTLGMEPWEIQQAALNNLRQIDAARQQYQLENSHVAGSIRDLVGRKSFIKTVRTVDGEDYSNLSMNPAEPLTVTTPGGLTVTFDPSGASTTRPDFPPEVVRLNELGARVQPSIKPALEAYRTAHNGQMPPNEQALVPYFATPKEGADYVEALEAKKAAGL